HSPSKPTTTPLPNSVTDGGLFCEMQRSFQFQFHLSTFRPAGASRRCFAPNRLSSAESLWYIRPKSMRSRELRTDCPVRIEESHMKIERFFAVLSVSFLLTSLPSAAQTLDTGILGTISDPQG